jgi:Tripartite tricarboxylate transporter family receptor
MDEGASGRREIRQPECFGADRRAAAGETHRHAGADGAVSRRRPGDDRHDVRAGRSRGVAGRGSDAAGAAGTIKALANLSPTRSVSLPDIPTSDEAGVPGYYMSGWFVLYAPKNTPPDVIGKLNAAMAQSLADPAVQKRLADLGLDVASRAQQSPEGLDAFQKAEVAKWWPIIKAAGIRGE